MSISLRSGIYFYCLGKRHGGQQVCQVSLLHYIVSKPQDCLDLLIVTVTNLVESRRKPVLTWSSSR